MNTAERIQLYHLEGDQREIAEVIGIDSYRKLIERFSGELIYIPQAKTLLLPTIKDDILKRYNGVNAKFLANKHGVTIRYVNKVIQNSRS